MRRARNGAAAALLALALAGCAGVGSAGSRAKLYDSIDALARDSNAVIVGTVVERETGADATVWRVEVENAPLAPGLGADLDAPAVPVAVGDVVEVRDTGAADSSAPPYPLEVGRQYAMYLTATGLTGAAADQYFLTGAGAGLFVREGDQFRRVLADSGDDLPDTIDIGE